MRENLRLKLCSTKLVTQHFFCGFELGKTFSLLANLSN